MKKTRIARIISLLLVVLTALAISAPAFAETVYATGIVNTNADLYQTVSGTTGGTILCTINSGSAVSIHSMTSNGAFYRVTVTTTSASYTGYVKYAEVTLSNSAATSSATVAYYDANGNPVYSYTASTSTTTSSSSSSSTGTQTEYYVNGVRYTGSAESATSGTTTTTGTTTTGTTTTGTSTATVVNCTSWVSLRQAASSGSNRLAKVTKGTTVTVNGTSGSYTYVTVSGKTGYILSSYLSTGSSSTTTVGTTATSGTYATQVATNYANAAAMYDDCVGYIMVPGTNISHPIMFSSSLYYDTHTPAGAKTSAASIYAYSNTLMNVTVVAGHNLRTSKTMFHALHDVQNALLSNSSSAPTPPSTSRWATTLPGSCSLCMRPAPPSPAAR